MIAAGAWPRSAKSAARAYLAPGHRPAARGTVPEGDCPFNRLGQRHRSQGRSRPGTVPLMPSLVRGLSLRHATLGLAQVHAPKPPFTVGLARTDVSALSRDLPFRGLAPCLAPRRTR